MRLPDPINELYQRFTYQTHLVKNTEPLSNEMCLRRSGLISWVLLNASHIAEALRVYAVWTSQNSDPIPMIIYCPIKTCGARHIDEGEFATKPHHTHSCQSCGHTWRHAIVPTVGVQFLPGFKNGAPS